MPKIRWMALLLLAGCGAGEEPRPAPPPPEAVSGAERCVVGLLTDDGVECPAMQSLDGEVYTLLGDLAGQASGDLVCVCGRPVEMSTCMQGTTLSISRIGSPALCP